MGYRERKCNQTIHKQPGRPCQTWISKIELRSDKIRLWEPTRLSSS